MLRNCGRRSTRKLIQSELSESNVCRCRKLLPIGGCEIGTFADSPKDGFKNRSPAEFFTLQALGIAVFRRAQRVFQHRFAAQRHGI